MKKDNEGFSLVELLISIVILAIIIVPVLDNIVMSATWNKKSREKQDVTMLAGNIVEMTKIEKDVSSIAEDLLYEKNQSYEELFTGMDASKVSVSQVEKKRGTYEQVTMPCISMNPDGSYSFAEDPKGSYTFAVKNLYYNEKPYDALITYDAGAYAEHMDSVNNQEVPRISSVATKENAVITEGYSDTWAASSLKHSYNQWFNTYREGTNTVTNDQIAASMTRAFTISVSYDETKAKYVVDGTILYTLKESLIPSSEENDPYRQFENTIYHSEFEKLSEVYLFYQPDFVHKHDTITFENNLPRGNSDIACNLIAQEKGTVNFEEEMKAYGVTFTLNETSYEPEDGAKGYHTTVKNNMGLEDWSNKRNQTNLSKEAQGNLIGLVEKESKTRLYEVTVAIYQSDERHTYAEENRITSMSSTKGVD